MNRITLALSILMLSIWVVIWWAFSLLNSEKHPSENLQDSLHSIIETVSPAVVSITGSSLLGDITTSRQWTGVIVSSSGMILTSRHLITKWFVYSITLNNGTILPAHFVKSHPSLDLALLAITSDTPLSLTVGTFINSQANVRQWDMVVAIGNALGHYPWSVSLGIVSGLARTVEFGTETLTWLIQTDIPISLGNSGWPLVSRNGKVIGINTGIVGGSAQIGWTLPLTQDIVEAFLK